jgi:hypothetical protein
VKRTLAGLLLIAALPLAAQTPAPAPEKPAATPAAEPRKPLILRLDQIEPGRRMSVGPSAEEKVQSQSLPSLGGDARALEKVPAGSRGSPFPKSPENVNELR